MKYLLLGYTPVAAWDAPSADAPSEEALAAFATYQRLEQELMPLPNQTDWPQIAMLYVWLERLTPTAPVQLSRIVAVAHAHGPARGLALLDDLNRRHHLDQNPLTRQREHAVRAHLLQQTGDPTTVATLYRRAAELTSNQVEQRYLRDKADHLN